MIISAWILLLKMEFISIVCAVRLTDAQIMYLKESREQKVHQIAEIQFLTLPELRFGNMNIHWIKMANQPTSVSVDPYVQEHIDLVTAIRTAKPINEAENTAISTMVAIMGRISAYTGKETTYEEMMNSDLKLGPKVFAFGPVDIDKTVPIAGLAYVPESASK